MAKVNEGSRAFQTIVTVRTVENVENVEIVEIVEIVETTNVIKDFQTKNQRRENERKPYDELQLQECHPYRVWQGTDC